MEGLALLWRIIIKNLVFPNSKRQFVIDDSKYRFALAPFAIGF